MIATERSNLSLPSGLTTRIDLSLQSARKARKAISTKPKAETTDNSTIALVEKKKRDAERKASVTEKKESVKAVEKKDCAKAGDKKAKPKSQEVTADRLVF